VLALLLVGLCLGTVAWRWSLSEWLDDGGRDLDLPGLRGRWVEHSSHQDMVGRLALPRLLHANEESVSGIGHPLFDHTNYFHPSSRVAWAVSRALASSSHGKIFAVQDPGYLALQEWRDRRRQQAAFTVRAVAALIFLVLAIPRTDSTMSIGDAPSTGLQVASVALWLLLLAAGLSGVLLVCGLRDRRHLWSGLKGANASRWVVDESEDVAVPPSRVRTVIGIVVLLGPLFLSPGLVIHSGDAELVNFDAPYWFLGCAVMLALMSAGGAMLLAGYSLRARWVAFLVAGFMAFWVCAVGPARFFYGEVWQHAANSPETVTPLMVVPMATVLTLIWLITSRLGSRSQGDQV